MMIKSMTARFGCLSGEKTEFHSGLNVITLPNEGGKSTRCAFILAMLCGIDSRERERARHIPAKTKYIPWSGGAPEGEMTVVSGGREIKITRKTTDPARPMRDFSAVYAQSGEKVPQLTDKTVCETLTGAGRELLLSSAVISHAQMRIGPTGELERKISALVSTGEEQSALTDTEQRLITWQRKRLYRRAGAIAEAESAIDEKREALARLGELEAERESLEKSLSDEREHQAAFRENEAKAEETRRRELYARLEAAKAEIERERARSDAGSGGVESSGAYEKTAGRHAAKPAFPVRAPVFAAIFAALMLIAAAALAILGKTVHAAIAVVLCAVGVVEALVTRRGSKPDTSVPVRGEPGSPTPNASRLAALIAEREALEHELLSPSAPAASPDGENAGLAAALAEVNAEIRALGARETLEDELAQLEAKLSELRRDYAAIGLALEEIRRAGEELSSRFSPEMCGKASEYFARLTGGRYDALYFDRALSAMAHERGAAVARECAYLSSGTVDEIYLALRLAIAELTLKKDAPLILDDALLCFDDERMARAMELLLEMSQTRQVLLFTCHSREEEWLKKRLAAN